MITKLEGKLKGCKQDFVYVAVLIAIALVIGIYLIVTTVMISKDGVFYIQRAQQFAHDPAELIKAHPPGHPFLILLAHKFVSLFTNSTSNQIWIYSAQSVNLLCRLLALIPLYLIGKLLVGSKNSFLGILILIFLPFPTKIVCDVVREWPYLLFLATGFFFLLWGAKYGKWWVFGLVGLSTGLGFLIRPESIQLIVYSLLWVATSMFKPELWGISRWKNLFALVLLFIGFAIPIEPYVEGRGKIIPPKVNRIMKSFSFNALPDKTDVPKLNTVSSNYYTAEMAPRNVLNALGEIFNTIGENLMWFFMPALVIGLHYSFRYNAKREEVFLITTLVLVSVTIMVLRYCYIELAVSKRWSLPLVTFTVCYIPVGLNIVGNWLETKLSMNKQRVGKKFSWFLVLFLLGIGICMPKLLRPVRIEKQGYKEAANWLKRNTAPTDVIAATDRRIAFYAERKGLIRYSRNIPKQAKYVVRIVKNEDEKPQWGGRTVQEKFSVWGNKREKKRRIVIYEVL